MCVFHVTVHMALSQNPQLNWGAKPGATSGSSTHSLKCAVNLLFIFSFGMPILHLRVCPCMNMSVCGWHEEPDAP